jgi:hypothetical protein
VDAYMTCVGLTQTFDIATNAETLALMGMESDWDEVHREREAAIIHSTPPEAALGKGPYLVAMLRRLDSFITIIEREGVEAFQEKVRDAVCSNEMAIITMFLAGTTLGDEEEYAGLVETILRDRSDLEALYQYSLGEKFTNEALERLCQYTKYPVYELLTDPSQLSQRIADFEPTSVQHPISAEMLKDVNETFFQDDSVELERVQEALLYRLVSNYGNNNRRHWLSVDDVFAAAIYQLSEYGEFRSFPQPQVEPLSKDSIVSLFHGIRPALIGALRDLGDKVRRERRRAGRAEQDVYALDEQLNGLQNAKERYERTMMHLRGVTGISEQDSIHDTVERLQSIYDQIERAFQGIGLDGLPASVLDLDLDVLDKALGDLDDRIAKLSRIETVYGRFPEEDGLDIYRQVEHDHQKAMMLNRLAEILGTDKDEEIIDTVAGLSDEVEELAVLLAQLKSQLAQARRVSEGSIAETEIVADLPTLSQELPLPPLPFGDDPIVALDTERFNLTHQVERLLLQLSLALHNYPCVAIEGVPGSGKTVLANALVAYSQAPAAIIKARPQMNKLDLLGSMQARDGDTVVEPSRLLRVAQKGGLIIIHDAHLLSPQARSAVYSIIDAILKDSQGVELYGEYYEISNQTKVIMTQNRGSKYGQSRGEPNPAEAQRTYLMVLNRTDTDDVRKDLLTRAKAIKADQTLGQKTPKEFALEILMPLYQLVDSDPEVPDLYYDFISRRTLTRLLEVYITSIEYITFLLDSSDLHIRIVEEHLLKKITNYSIGGDYPLNPQEAIELFNLIAKSVPELKTICRKHVRKIRKSVS